MGYLLYGSNVWEKALAVKKERRAIYVVNDTT